MGENICKYTSLQGLIYKMYKAVKKLNIKTKNKTPNNPNWQVTWVDISQKKTYKWPMGTLKGVQPYNHFSSVQFSHSVVSDSLQPHGP